MHQDKSEFKLGSLEKGLIIFVVLAVVAVGVAAWLADNKSKSLINSFSDCVSAGNPITETYPETCAVGGRTFTNVDQKIEPVKVSHAYVDMTDAPEGWQDDGTHDDYSVALALNPGLEEDSSVPICALQVKVKEIQATDSSLVTADALFEEANQKIEANKGYQTNVKGIIHHSISLNGDKKSVEFHDLTRVLGDVEINSFEAYVIGSEYYSSIVLSCNQGSPQDVVEILQVLKLEVY